MPKAQVIERTKLVREPIPEALLRPCPVDPLPEIGITNLDLAAEVVRRRNAQVACNRRFDELREWQSKLEETTQ